MRTKPLTSAIGGLLLAGIVGLAPATAQSGDDEMQTVRGAVVSIDKSRITIESGSYAIRESTALEDQGGQRVEPSEVRPGTPVELELEGGRLATIRAQLVR